MSTASGTRRISTYGAPQLGQVRRRVVDAGEAATRPQHAHELSERAIFVRHVVERVVARDDVEALVVERQ